MTVERDALQATVTSLQSQLLAVQTERDSLIALLATCETNLATCEGSVNPTGPAEQVLFTVANSGTTQTGKRVRFLDSGGEVGVYAGLVQYRFMKFDAGAGQTWSLKFGPFSFQQLYTGTYMDDRLGLRVSNDGVTYTNVNVPWMLTMNNPAYPWSGFLKNNAPWTDPQTQNGWVLPKDNAQAIAMGWDGTSPVVLPYRFVEFTFFSDGATELPGWDITLTSTGYVAP
jgi:hypothetical protein